MGKKEERRKKRVAEAIEKRVKAEALAQFEKDETDARLENALRKAGLRVINYPSEEAHYRKMKVLNFAYVCATLTKI